MKRKEWKKLNMAVRNTYGGKFCSPDERQIATIGTSYIANFLSGGGAKQAGATLTNRRIYFSGKVFSFNDNGHLSSVKQRKIVNVRDVTGVGYIQYNPIQYLVWGFAVLIFGIMVFALTGTSTWQGWEPSPLGIGGLVTGMQVSICLIVLFFLYRKTLLSIEYAGGNIAFDARWLQSNEEDTFIRNIHLAKDKLYSVAAVEQGFVGGGEEIDADDTPDL